MLGAISAFVSVVLYYIGLLLVFVALFTFLLPQLLPLVRFKQNLKTKYDAEWAIVTGGPCRPALAGPADFAARWSRPRRHPGHLPARSGKAFAGLTDVRMF